MKTMFERQYKVKFTESINRAELSHQSELESQRQMFTIQQEAFEERAAQAKAELGKLSSFFNIIACE